ncbi:MAG: hypothetical protein QM781_17935 [Chitinophagaceae bacterium]
MTRLKYLLLIAIIACVSSCKNKQNNFYAIKDFRKPVQPFLHVVASKGMVTYYDSSQISIITDAELVRLGKSENPILRATAYSQMLKRKSFNKLDVILNHLDDTSMVAIDEGEFGMAFRRVSDFILLEANWERFDAKDRVVDRLITKHNYLSTAYTMLPQLNPQERYYSYIKDMAIRPRHTDPYQGYELGFGDIEYALYGLAKFRKGQDVPVIRHTLLKHVGDLSDVSFRLMKEFPDTAYLDVLQIYHTRFFYRFSGVRPHGFTGVAADRAAPEDFINALVAQKSEQSAIMLDTMLHRLAGFTCMPDRDNIMRAVVAAIRENPCSAYVRLRKKSELKPGKF